MSIVLYTGKPGAGKTYRVVKELLEDEGRYYVFHNIDGLKDSLIEGGRYIQSWVGMEGFFTKKKQEEISTWARATHNRSVLVIVDEAQMVMGERNSEIKAWLSWHRHLGQDIKLICQHYRMINQDLYNLCDYEIRGKRGYITSQLVYQWSVNGEVFKTDRLRVSKGVFAAYTSFVGGEVNKGRSNVLLYAAGACALAVVMGVYVIGYGLPQVFAKASGPAKTSKSNQQQPNQQLGKKQQPKPAKPPSDPVLDKMMSVSFAGLIENRVLVQDTKTLGIFPLSDILDYRLVECSGKSALVMTKEKGLMRINVRRSRYLTASKIGEGGARSPVPPPPERAPLL